MQLACAMSLPDVTRLTEFPAELAEPVK
jgi:hypothetical protein